MFLFCFQFFSALFLSLRPGYMVNHALLATEHLQQLFESAEYLDDVMFELDKGDGGGEGGRDTPNSQCKVDVFM